MKQTKFNLLQELIDVCLEPLNFHHLVLIELLH
jgi:hypothetical protein